MSSLGQEGQVAKDQVRRRQDEVVEIQASICRRWIAATREFDKGECTREEYEDYCKILRSQAQAIAREEDPHFQKPASVRAEVYAAPIRLGYIASSFRALCDVSEDGDVVMPGKAPVSEWAMVPNFGPKHLQTPAWSTSRATVAILDKGQHPKRLQRKHHPVEDEV